MEFIGQRGYNKIMLGYKTIKWKMGSRYHHEERKERKG